MNWIATYMYLCNAKAHLSFLVKFPESDNFSIAVPH